MIYRFEKKYVYEISGVLVVSAYTHEEAEEKMEELLNKLPRGVDIDEAEILTIGGEQW